MIRLLLAAAIATVASLAGTRVLIALFRARNLTQPIRDDGPDTHARKHGTPTMGGLAIVAGACAGYAGSDFIYGGIFTRTGIFVMLATLAATCVGLLDDWLKVTRADSRGLSKRAKMLGLCAVGAGFATVTVLGTDVSTELSFTRVGSIGWDLGPVGWVLWAVLIVTGTSNAVNFTDGLDGLAAGSSIFNFAAFTIIGYWAFRHVDLYRLPHALDLAVVGAAMLGGCVGFLWWNAAPAQIIMGDTGSLAVGTALACLALTTNTHLLLPIMCGLFVMEALSVILQIGVFKWMDGRRLFAMAPLHHHFEKRGWHETWVIVRFWLLAGFATAVALGLFYADYFPLLDSQSAGAAP
ncbi:MAG: phospho-N-acetylmuramoyl-pentapeptide-transferase [bacterium]|nr:phospho-N-acetylmuramoyl-pentapeptide-transferase [bacterium]MCY3924477.1 phospho-N-acetylmuramoyl-pentapeptide-transferase [bacterium]